jgi:hypothetical protein
MWPVILEIVKAGGVTLGVAVALCFFYVFIKIALPVLKGLQPANGKSDSAGAIFMALQQLANLPGEVKSLSAAIEALMPHVPTKAELLKEFEENRHDVRNIMTGPITELTVQVRTNTAAIH